MRRADRLANSTTSGKDGHQMSRSCTSAAPPGKEHTYLLTKGWTSASAEMIHGAPDEGRNRNELSLCLSKYPIVHDQVSVSAKYAPAVL